MWINFRRAAVGLSALAFLGFSPLAAPQARADFFSEIANGAGASTFGVLYEGHGGHALNYNTFAVTGNVGIGGTGLFMGSNGSHTSITGSLEFSAMNSGQFTSGGVMISGNGGVPLYGQTAVQTYLNQLNTLSQNLGAEAGTSLTINNGMTAVSITSGMLDAHGNYVFNTTLSNFNTGSTLTITGDGTHNVVFNIPSTSAGINGNIVLSNIGASQVLFNFTGGNYTTLSGGSTLSIANNESGTTNVARGIFLDPNGNISVNNSAISGWLFGGDTQDEAIVSGGFLNVPVSTPEPSSALLLVGMVLGMGGIRFVRRQRALPVP